MKTLIIFEWRRAFRSFFVWGVTSLLAGLCLLLFWFAQTGVTRYRQQQQAVIAQQSQRIDQLIAGYRADAADDTKSQTEQSTAKHSLALALRLSAALATEQQAIDRRDGPAFLKAAVRQDTTTLALDLQNSAVSGTPPAILRARIARFQPLLRNRWAWENPAATTQPVGFLLNWQTLLAQPLALLFAVVFFSTPWLAAQFTGNRDLMRTNLYPIWHWAAANWLCTVFLWTGFLLAGTVLGWLLTTLWGQPLLSGMTPWSARFPGTRSTYFALWLQKLVIAWGGFAAGTGLWLSVTAWVAERWRHH